MLSSILQKSRYLLPLRQHLHFFFLVLSHDNCPKFKDMRYELEQQFDKWLMSDVPRKELEKNISEMICGEQLHKPNLTFKVIYRVLHFRFYSFSVLCLYWSYLLHFGHPDVATCGESRSNTYIFLITDSEATTVETQTSCGTGGPGVDPNNTEMGKESVFDWNESPHAAPVQ